MGAGPKKQTTGYELIMTTTNRSHLVQSAGTGIEALAQVEEILKGSGFDPILRHLVKLRVSQINGCAFCVKMHNREAREDGESNDRLDHVVVWRHVDLFTDAEKAALAWAEALTTRGTNVGLEDLHNRLEQHLSREDIGTLTLIVVMINTWNRLQIAMHNEAF